MSAMPPARQTLLVSALAFALFSLSSGFLPAGAQVSLPPEEQVGPNCVGEPHHVELDDATIDLNRVCVTVVVKDPDSASGVDADTLDGLDSAQFLRSDASGLLSGSLSVTGSLRLDGSTSGANALDATAGLLAPTSGLFWGSAQVWTSTHDGAGSGLDADTLDGFSSGAFLGINGKAADADKLDGLDGTAFLLATGKASDADRLDGFDSTAFLLATGKASDADRLDGLDGGQFLRSDASGILSGSLSLTGDLRLGSSGAACTASNEGAQRYSAPAKEMELCDGASWRRAGLPAGAVVAFDLAACPAGWTAFTAANGRNIIGSGTYALGATGGEESHALTIAEMPAHAHVERVPSPQSSSVVAASASDAPGGSRISMQPSSGALDGGDLMTGDTGGSAAHNVMDPYIALLYCKKS